MQNIIRNHVNTFLHPEPITQTYSPATHIYFVLLVSGICGFCLGFVYPEWQIAVEGAQVVARIVHYPRDSSFYIYQTKLWTLLHQICALFLYGGVSERILSLILSGIVCMISCQGLSLCVLSLCSNRLLSIATPFLILFSNAYDFGVSYPIYLMGFVHTYGVFGLSFIVLVIGFIGVRQYKIGGVLLGIAPAIHCSLGSWLWLVFFMSCVWDYHNRNESFRKLIVPFLVGVTISVISLLMHFLMTYDVPTVPYDVITTYRDIGLRQWDCHRIQADFSSIGIYLNIATLFIGLFCLLFLKHEIPHHVLFLMRILIVCSLLGLGLSIVPFMNLPLMVNVFMPLRILNINVFIFCALLIGLLNRFRHLFSIQLCLSVFVTILALVGLKLLSHDWVILSLYSLPFLFILSLYVPHDNIRFSSIKRKGAFILKGITIIMLTLIMIVVGNNIYDARQSINEALLDDWQHDAFFQAIAEGEGFLLTASGIGLIQLRTRRPLLINSESIDIVIYAPEIGPELNRVLRRIYGVDLFENYSPESQPPLEINKSIWERRTLDEWKNIKKEFNVTDVLTYSDWTLQLPIVAQNGEYILYHIPT